MCGFLGFTAEDRGRLHVGLSTIAHRGPDAEGVLVMAGVTLGHRRLSIIDIGPGSNQPMTCDNVSIVFNGEIYNFQELRDSLETEGVVFTTSGDTEVILRGYQTHGIAFFSRMRGMYAFAIHDRTERKLILARDMFGIKPLFYAIHQGILYFASEVKALRAILPRLTPNAGVYHLYFTLGYIPGSETCFTEVHQVLPGHIALWDEEEGCLTDIPALLPALHPAEDGMMLERAESCVDLALRESVSAHYVADVPVNLLLSGGNDSSLLAGISKALGKTPSCFHLAVKGSIDTEYALRVAKYLDMPLEVIEMSERSFTEQYNAVLDSIDIPTGDTSIIPTSLVYKAIQGRGKVVLSGEGGDEVFGGYLRHRSFIGAHSGTDEWSNALLERLWQGTSNAAIMYRNPAISRIQGFLMRHGYIRDIRTLYLKGVRLLDYPYEMERVRQDLKVFYESSSQSAWTPLGLFYDLWMYLPYHLMQKNDTASMAASIEGRVPFLDRRFIETIISTIPQRYLLSSQFTEKALLKKVTERYLPKDLIYRKKSGFGFSPMRYSYSRMRDDLIKSLHFHLEHANDFGIPNNAREIFTSQKSDILLKKYPRFAFSLITNWRVWGG